jgi:prepilin-type N-terminal cleavage/methylation domain-containing protein
MKNAYGFTVVELLIVIVVVAILAAVSVIGYTNIKQRAYESSITMQLSQIRKEMEAQRVVNGEWPFSTDPSWCTGATNYVLQNLNSIETTSCNSGGVGSVSFECMGVEVWASDDNQTSFRTIYISRDRLGVSPVLSDTQTSATTKWCAGLQ